MHINRLEKRSRSKDRRDVGSDSDIDSGFREGEKIEAKVPGWSKYYEGKVVRVRSDGTYDFDSTMMTPKSVLRRVS